jgi:transposase
MVPGRPARVLVATLPVDFRKGMDGSAAPVQEYLKDDPFSGTVSVFRRSERTESSWFGGTAQPLSLCGTAGAGRIPLRNSAVCPRNAGTVIHFLRRA